MSNQITIADLLKTRPISAKERDLLTRKIEAELKRDSGKSEPFRLAVGDKVENFAMYTDGYAQPCGTVSEVYRENGHNRVATETGFHREQDLARRINGTSGRI